MQTRKRHQTGSVQQRMRQGKLKWVGLYRDATGRRCITDLEAKTKSQAETKMAEFLVPVNMQTDQSKNRDVTVGNYVEHIYIPFKQRRWKASTALMDGHRLRQHMVNGELRDVRVRDLNRDNIQAFLDARQKKYSRSVLNHLRFDFRSILKLAKSDQIVKDNAAEVVFTPRKPKFVKPKRAMTLQEVKLAIDVQDLRERLFLRLAIIAGMRPGEIVGLKWTDVEGEKGKVERRVYKGVVDTTKNDEERDTYLPYSIRHDLTLWHDFAPKGEYVFSSEKGTPMWYENLWTRNIQPRLEKIGLDWVNYQAMRLTNSTLMHQNGADPKAAAAQRGHDIGVSIDEYTQITMEQKMEAVNKLESMLMLIQ